MPSDFSNFQPPNPFHSDLAPEGPWMDGLSVPLHAGALEDLEELLALAGNEAPAAAGRGQGTAVLLRAPRAGFGKSHLLGRLRSRAEAGAGAFVVSVTFDPEGGVGWKSAFKQVLEHWHAAAPAAGAPPGLSTLDVLARRIFALLNAELIRSGQVPCAQPAHALASLERDYLAMFDFADRRQAVGQWFQENFETLLTAGLPYLKTLTALPETLLELLMRAFCGYAQGGAEEDPRRLETLQWALREPAAAPARSAPRTGPQVLVAGNEDAGFHRGMLTALCRLAAVCRPLVVMLDHLDGFYSSPDDLLRLGRLITEWRRLSGRTVLVLSVNEDLWAGSFQKSLPSALEDRLTGVEVSLGGISAGEAAALIRSRLENAKVPPAVARSFTAHLDLPGIFERQSPLGAPLSPRALLRLSARAWKDYWKPAGAPAVAPVSQSPLPFPSVPPLALAPLPPPAAPWPPEPQEPQPWAAASLPPLPLVKNASPEPSFSAAAPRDPDPVWVPATAPMPASAPAQIPRHPPPAPPGVEHTLAGRFQGLRAHFASAPTGLGLDHDRLQRLIKWSGQRLAVLRYAEMPLPGLPGRKAAVWQTPDGEILFGTEPHGDQAYWRALLAIARQRYHQIPGCRLVLFSVATAPVNLSAWLPQDEIISARARFLDLQTLTQPELATLYAADEVLREAERGSLAIGSPDAFAAMAPRLEFFWKRLTRPLRGW